MELEGDTPPFWSQHPQRHRHRRQSSPILNPVALILAIPIIFLLILFFVVPPIISHVNEVIRPNSVKKSWDSINIVLVLFAVFCGVFTRRNDETLSSDDVGVAQNQNQDTIVSNFDDKPRQSVSSWLDFPDRKEYNRMSSGVRLKRSSSSYPDLRQESLWESGGGNSVKFYDDFEVNKVYRSPPREKLHRRRRRINKAEKEKEEKQVETHIQENSDDKFEVESAPPPPTPPEPKSPAPPPAPPPPPSTASLKRRRSFHNVPRKEDKESRNQGKEAELSEIQPSSSSPPPPPSEPESHSSPESIRKKLQRNMSNTKEIATAIASLYKGQRRKKKKKVRIILDNIDETAQQHSPPPSSPPPPQYTPIPPPPPPPPPPSKVLQNLFKKSSKSKRIHSISANAPPPPPPPPPSSIFNSIFKNGTKSQRFKNAGNAIPPPPPPPPSSILNSLFKNATKGQRFKNVRSAIPPPPPPPPSSILNSLFKNGSKSLRFKNASTTPPPPPPPPPPGPRMRLNFSSAKPPKPTRTNTRYDESVIVAPPSPLIPMPPPPPPFTMHEAKFVAQGDFVRIQSANSSRCSSPEREDFDTMSIKSEGGDPMGPSVSCPSPDVNAKADSFIARLRDEWRLEKINSVRNSGPT